MCITLRYSTEQVQIEETSNTSQKELPDTWKTNEQVTFYEIFFNKS